MTIQGQCFHSYDDELYAEERESGKAEEEGGGGIKGILMSIVGSGRGSLKGGSGIAILILIAGRKR